VASTPRKVNGASTALKTTPGRPSDARPLNNAKAPRAQPGRGQGFIDTKSNKDQGTPSVTEPAPSPLPSIADQEKTTEAQGMPPAAQQPISQGSVTVSFSTYPSLRIPPELRSEAVRAKLRIGHVVSRIDPVYPADAERQRVEGTVNLHAIIGTDGSVKGIEGISGPPSLVPAAASAVRQWRYQPTLLGDQPIETAQGVTIVFRLSTNAASAN